MGIKNEWVFYRSEYERASIEITLINGKPNYIDFDSDAKAKSMHEHLLNDLREKLK